MEGPPGRYVIVGRGSSLEIPASMLKPLAGRAQAAIQLDTLKVDFRTEGGKVVATGYALTAPQGDPRRYEDAHKHLLGVHSARLDQTLELKELEKMGYQSVTYRVVTAKPPVPTHPTLISKARSIELELASGDRAKYKVVMRNVSDRDVMGYAFGGSQNMTSSTSVDASRPLIKARAVHEAAMPVGSPIILAAALFADGTHEGDREAAARMYAQWMGHETQRRRADPAIQAILEDKTQDDDAKIARIRSELTKLPKKPDARMLDAMRAAFPGVPSTTMERDLAQGLDAGIHNIWGSLYSFEHQSGVYPPPKSRRPLKEWWPRR